ncbi:unnamed protein product [Cylicocyclus nassatus]|uniref:Uncharacterized protein n=1 Tax=Cylicocyclus nassatus TaxID=53992 RepID=A0AA36HAR2_CYLNA|nr:unnamed protein product [Cylicocyclus nassatus]
MVGSALYAQLPAWLRAMANQSKERPYLIVERAIAIGFVAFVRGSEIALCCSRKSLQGQRSLLRELSCESDTVWCTEWYWQGVLVSTDIWWT